MLRQVFAGQDLGEKAFLAFAPPPRGPMLRQGFAGQAGLNTTTVGASGLGTADLHHQHFGFTHVGMAIREGWKRGKTRHKGNIEFRTRNIE